MTSSWSSPRPWRCFQYLSSPCTCTRVFSTSVEVFPNHPADSGDRARLLHVRGGVSSTHASLLVLAASSPRPWRCFRGLRCSDSFCGVFSTSVEVFLTPVPIGIHVPSLLHVRGGVSISKETGRMHTGSSPRPWRCFSVLLRHVSQSLVFSTSVEVFLKNGWNFHDRNRLLHVRGGVSDACGRFRPIAVVFSTSVEVFPLHTRVHQVRLCLLHVRGGVSLTS